MHPLIHSSCKIHVLVIFFNLLQLETYPHYWGCTHILLHAVTLILVNLILPTVDLPGTENSSSLKSSSNSLSASSIMVTLMVDTPTPSGKLRVPSTKAKSDPMSAEPATARYPTVTVPYVPGPRTTGTRAIPASSDPGRQFSGSGFLHISWTDGNDIGSQHHQSNYKGFFDSQTFFFFLVIFAYMYMYTCHLCKFMRCITVQNLNARYRSFGIIGDKLLAAQDIYCCHCGPRHLKDFRTLYFKTANQ